MYTLGINAAYHDSAACLVRDGVPLAAAEEERFTRIKHGKRPFPSSTYELPYAAIDYCLREAGIKLVDVDAVAYSYDPALLLGAHRDDAILTLRMEPSAHPAATLGELGLAMAQPLGAIGSLLFAVTLFATCLGAALEVVLGLSYNIAQGFGWEWGENKLPAEASRFNVTLLTVLVLATLISLIGVDPLQLALFASTIIALFLPISLSPLLIIMNDRDYLKEKTNGRITNIALVFTLLLAFAAAVVSLPLLFLSGGG